MSHVNVLIGGRQYRMACEDGQESHLQELARGFDERVAQLRGNFGEIGDLRLTVMAALMLADELAEAQRKLSEEGTRRSHEEGRSAAAEAHVEQTRTTVASALNSAAE